MHESTVPIAHLLPSVNLFPFGGGMQSFIPSAKSYPLSSQPPYPLLEPPCLSLSAPPPLAPNPGAVLNSLPALVIHLLGLV